MSNFYQANYKDTGVAEYKDNILIEALPPIYNYKQAFNILSQFPIVEPHEIELSNEVRFHSISKIKYKFYQPLKYIMQLEKKISMIIRQGYVGRNPIKGYLNSHLQNGGERIIQTNLNAKVFDDITTTASGISVFGFSGCGKSRALERIIAMYPRVIEHSKSSIIQIPIIKIDCPTNGDLKELCVKFFSQIDQLLNTQYLSIYAAHKTSVDTMIAQMAQLANFHAIGVIVIDEIQNLNESRSGGTKKMQSFFVSLVNTIGIPLVQVGTYEAITLYEHTFSSARRITGFGSLFWDRLADDEQWGVFIKSLWRFQWLKKTVPLDSKSNNTMYNLSQGIIDIAINIFMLSQTRAIELGIEMLSPRLLETIYTEELKPIHKMLNAIRNGDADDIANYSDLITYEIENLKTELSTKSTHNTKETPFSGAESLETSIIQYLENLDIDTKLSINIIKEVINNFSNYSISQLILKILTKIKLSEKKPKKEELKLIMQKDWNKLPNDDLRYIYSKNKGKSIYETLKKKNIILDFTNLIDGNSL